MHFINCLIVTLQILTLFGVLSVTTSHGGIDGKSTIAAAADRNLFSVVTAVDVILT